VSTLRAALLLLVAAAAAMLPQALLLDWTGTEGRRVQIALEMLQTGNYVVPTLFFEPTFAKPPLHYWILSSAAALLGEGHLALRLPSMLAVWLLATLAFVLQRRAFSETAGWIAALGIVCSPLVVHSFPTAEIDPIFACLTAGSICLLAYGASRDSGAFLLLAGGVGALALLSKGVPYLMFAAGAWTVWIRHRRMRGALLYFVPLLALPLVWVLMLRADPANAAAAEVAGRETVGRLAGYQWKHLWDLPSYFLRAVLIQAPLVFWCFWEHRGKRDARMGADDLLLRMCSGAAIVAVLVLALFPQKPTRYLLPNVPLFTFAVAPAAAHYALYAGRIGAFGQASLRVLGVLGALMLMALPWVPAPIPPRTPVLAIALALLPFAVRTPRALIAMCLWLPILASWTALADWRERWMVGPRAVEPYAPILQSELRRIGAAPEAVEGYGHVHGSLLLGAGLLPIGQEEPYRAPKKNFVLRESVGVPPLGDAFVERMRLRAGNLVFVVEERSAPK